MGAWYSNWLAGVLLQMCFFDFILLLQQGDGKRKLFL
jgi:hypothetical protein